MVAKTQNVFEKVKRFANMKDRIVSNLEEINFEIKKLEELNDITDLSNIDKFDPDADRKKETLMNTKKNYEELLKIIEELERKE